MLRRSLVGGLAISTTAVTAAWNDGRAQAALDDGHAAGREAVRFANGAALLPRRPGEAPGFTASLDQAVVKATSGGWAREITARQLPLATGIALAHLFLNPGGAREMHWHDSAEWAYVMEGRAQASVFDPDGSVEVFDVGPGDLWYFPRGYAHAIQTLGEAPCHALLAFNDGLYSEHGTFGISDVMSRIDPTVLAQTLGVPRSSLLNLPAAETYVMQGAVISAEGQEARAENVLPPSRSRRFQLLASPPTVHTPGGTIHIASCVEYPASAAMSGLRIRLEPGALQEFHWHPDANEMHYVVGGHVRISMFGPDKHLGTAEIGPGDCAYVPRSAGHILQNTGSVAAEIVAVQDAGTVTTATLSDCLAHAPKHLLANNLGIQLADRPPSAPGTRLPKLRGNP